MFDGLMSLQSRRVVPRRGLHIVAMSLGTGVVAGVSAGPISGLLSKRRKVLEVIAEIALLKFCLWWFHVGVVAVGLSQFWQGIFCSVASRRTLYSWSVRQQKVAEAIESWHIAM